MSGGSYSTYAYANGDPISKKDPLGLDPWGGLNGGVTPEEAEALSVEQEFNYWFNTPNPCVKQQLERDHPRLADFISEFSALNLTQGFWNTAPGGAAGAWASEGAGAATKVGIVKWLNRASEGLGENAARALEWLLPPVVAYSTYQHVKAADESINNCGCSQ